MDLMVGRLPSKYKVFSSNPTTEENKKEEERGDANGRDKEGNVGRCVQLAVRHTQR
jgi:hypothetical protein